MASWVSAIVAIAVMLGTSAMMLWRGGRTEGKITTILEQLVKIADDHEERLRAREAGDALASIRRHHHR